MGAMRIAEMARVSGFPPATLRYYETIGLVAPERDANGYRRYGRHDVDRLRLVAGAKRLGLRLEDISELVALRADGCPPVRQRFSELVAEGLDRARRSIVELNSLVEELSGWSAGLADAVPPAECGSGCGCPDHGLGVKASTARPSECSLADDELADRVGEWRSVLAASTSADRTERGWRIHFPPEPDLAGRLAALAAAERQCCPSFGFTMEMVGDTITLDVTVPSGSGPGVDALVAMRPGSAAGRRAEVVVASGLDP